MLSDLRTAQKVIGVKQSKKAIREGVAARVYIALDAEPRVTQPIYELCSQTDTAITEIATMAELGDAVGIDVGAAVVTLVR
ncbi:ribosomal L7Ae/L30e/S12e/Gadd45 family protein [Butyricicoccus sp. Marseille-Q5471]|uniref:ribosomal L7Ae/L30e/S12e/Gadd45 family protein n=1 Tax=Butyricicoccus sp. Marseille-Q5471 TaxID=3039493 RepID=UPI0024BD4C7F|nr:ribosomal L7Ae/L30e/S12e/Gadd45 family protein [Butyricicoccus sp. Marseille-Q5471]